MCTYYSKYIPSFSNICKPLYDRVSDFGDWQNYEIDAFNALKAAISKAILVIPTSDQKFILRTDASNNAVSAILETDKHQPVYFCSRLLNKTEINWDVLEKEAFAIYWGISVSYTHLTLPTIYSV